MSAHSPEYGTRYLSGTTFLLLASALRSGGDHSI